MRAEAGREESGVLFGVLLSLMGLLAYHSNGKLKWDTGVWSLEPDMCLVFVNANLLVKKRE